MQWEHIKEQYELLNLTRVETAENYLKVGSRVIAIKYNIDKYPRYAVSSV